MTSFPLVSIIIPFYNRPKAVIKAINSALSQTYDKFEIIVVDDGSEETIEGHSILDNPEITFIRHKKNLGANAARNTGFNSSKGKWISFLDSDDTWDPTKVELMIEAILENGDYSVAYCGMKKMLNGKLQTIHIAKKSGNIYEELLEQNIVGSASIPVIKRSVYQELNGFDDSLKSAQDWDLWLRIADRGHLFLAIPEILVNYSIPVNDSHISGSETAFWEGRLKFLKKHKAKYSGEQKKLLGRIYSNMGFLFLHRFNNRRKACWCFVKSIVSKPNRIKSWRGLLGVFLPNFLLRKYLKNRKIT